MSDVMTMPDYRKDIEAQLAKNAQYLYEQSNRKFVPMYPWVFVYVLPKEQVTKAGIVLPDIDQNKTVHEGIVLATWRPFTEETGVMSAEQAETKYGIKEHVNFKYTRLIEQRSDMVPGDHVLFLHWAGVPIEGYSDKHFRVVRERDWKESEQGGIIAKVEYEGSETRPGAVLRDMLDTMLSPGNLDRTYRMAESVAAAMSLLAAKIEHRFLLIDRERKSVTLSGR